MISDDLLLYLLFQMILLIINVLGFTKIPALSIFGILGTMLIAIATIEAFGDYYLFAMILLLMNISIPIFGLIKNMRK